MPAIFDSSYTSRMRIATWNVNGLRARATQLRAWLERERPDLVCPQKLKAEERQIPDDCKLGDYHAFWHCRKAYPVWRFWFEKTGPHPFRYTLTRRSTCNRARFRYVHWLRAVTSTGSMPWIARRPVGLQRLEASWKCWRFWSRRSDLNR